MLFKEKLTKVAKNIFLGRKISIIDNLIFKISNRKINGWLIGNKIRNKFANNRNYISNMPIIFVGGCPRSGTFLLYNLLKISKDTSGPTEEICIFQDTKNYKLIKNAFEINKKELGNFAKEAKKDIIKLSELILRRYMEKKKIKNLALKAPKNILFVDELFKYFPNSKYINITRDIRDTALSMEKHFLEHLDEKHPFKCHVKTWTVCINQAKNYKENKKFFEIKYEDLVNAPYKTLRRICRFLNITCPPKKDIKNYYKKIDRKELSKLSKSHFIQLSKPIYKNRVGAWKKKINFKQKKDIKKFAGKELIELGYEKDNNW